MTKFYWELDRAAHRILEAVSLTLSLSEAEKGHLFNLHSGHNNQLGLLHYPPISTERLRNQVMARMPAHCDWWYEHGKRGSIRHPLILKITDAYDSTLTLLFQDECGGLEFEDPNHPGSFIPATPVPGALTLNVGRYAPKIQQWYVPSILLKPSLTPHDTDVFPSASHRVTLPPPAASATQMRDNVTRERFSIPYFVAPDADKIVSCFSSCVSDGQPAKFEPVSFAEYGASISRYQYKEKAAVAA